MFGTLALGLFSLSLLFAAWKLFRLYQAHFSVGSASWNAHQIALREELARLSSHRASAEDAQAFALKEQRYIRRLELQLAHDVFPDEVERRRAERYEALRRLEDAQVFERLEEGDESRD